MRLCRELINEASIATLARSYNILDFRQNLENIVSYAFYDSSHVKQYSKKELHSIINEVLYTYHKGENTLKAKLVELFIKKNVTAAFEIKVNNSRVDFLTVNGESKSFEIKSELDNLTKLSKQVNDYEKVFDYNYIVIDEKHYTNALKLIPEHYGIMVLKDNSLIERKASTLNSKLDCTAQLELFTKKEFSQFFKIKDISVEEVLINFEPNEINFFFKEMLKGRYRKKWNFLLSNLDSILPIDYQFFFNHNIRPEVIYDGH